MTAMPRVSIVMSVYNGLPYLPAAFDSILNQTFTDFEFVVIDDSSTDGSEALLREYAASDARVVLVRNERNLGLVTSLNKGLALTRGEYIARQDADDISLPQRLEKQVAFLDSHPAVGLLGTLTQVIDAQGQPVHGTGHFMPLTDNAALQAQLLRNNPFCHGSVMLRRICLERSGPYDPRAITEDYELWLRLAEVTELAKVEPVLYLYRVHSGALSLSISPRVYMDSARVLGDTLQRRFGAAPPVEHLAAIAHHYLRAAQAAYRRNELELACQAVRQALALSPSLFGSSELLSELESVYLPDRPFASGQAFTQMIFSGLPPDPATDRLRGRLLSTLHMREVFQGAAARDWARVRAHIAPGLRLDPRWRLNRGVWVIWLKALAGAR
ncbi:MAG: glycosyltransferase family 2 protein [Anaerolineales bacterium]